MDFLKGQIGQHIQNKEGKSDCWIIHCSNQVDLSEAIAFAEIAENQLGKRHPHKYRRSKLTLEKFVNLLVGERTKISKVTSFHDLLEVVKSCKVKDIGPLTFYDTATRIGAYLKIYPEMIYLHTGTRIGVEKLLDRKIKSDTLERSELPAVFQDPRITCDDIEDILCHLSKLNGGEKKELKGFRKGSC